MSALEGLKRSLNILVFVQKNAIALLTAILNNVEDGRAAVDPLPTVRTR